MKRIIKLPILWRYILKEFFNIFILCLLTATTLFLVIETFEKTKTFIRHSAPIHLGVSYILLKIPWIIQLMLPVATLISTLLCIGKLSQKSEITAMRACGSSTTSLIKPLLAIGLLISLFLFINGETIVPWSLNKSQDIFSLDIKKRAIKGDYNKENFWFRDDNLFYNVGYYNSRDSKLNDISIFKLNSEFDLEKKVDAESARWSDNELVRWTMYNVTEVADLSSSNFLIASHPKLPLIIEEKPSYFYNSKRKAETLSFFELSKLIEKNESEGISASNYKVDLISKIAFPFINIIVVLLAFPLAILPSRSNKLAFNLVVGLSFGFSYYVFNSIFRALGSAELIDVYTSAWATNILFTTIGVYMLSKAEFN